MDFPRNLHKVLCKCFFKRVLQKKSIYHFRHGEKVIEKTVFKSSYQSSSITSFWLNSIEKILAPPYTRTC